MFANCKTKALGLVALALLATMSAAQTTNSYQQTNLVSDIPGMAAHTDAQLVNPWGISLIPQQPLWIADNGSGFSTVYDGSGGTQLQPVGIPPAAGTGPAPVTGTVGNATPDFAIHGVPSLFLFDTEDGTISGWGGAASATFALNNSATGAVYKGLAIGSNASGNLLFAANFHSGKIEVYDKNFGAVASAGGFADPQLPAGYAPFGIQNIGNNQIVVTYALQDSAKKDDVAGAGNGFVDLFDTDGHLVRRIASQGALNSPWGIALAPSSFGTFAGALLIGNFGDGRINAFDLASGNSLGQLNNTSGQPLGIDGLWALTFGGGGLAGDAATLYFTAGLNGETHGLFGTLTPAAATSGGDFTMNADQKTLTVPRGGSSTLKVTVGDMNGFNGDVVLSCPGAPAMLTCTFSPGTITAGGTGSTLTVSVASTYMVGRTTPLRHKGGLLLAMSMFGGMSCLIAGGRNRKLVTVGAIAVLAILVLGLASCGGYKAPAAGGGNPNSVTLNVTGTSGSVTHSTSVAVTVQ